MVKNPHTNAGDTGSIPGLERPPGEGNGNPLQYSCLENPMDRGAWWATVRGVSRVRHNLMNKTNHHKVSEGSFNHIPPFLVKITGRGGGI